MTATLVIDASNCQEYVGRFTNVKSIDQTIIELYSSGGIMLGIS